jgi:hypothetical protein
LDGLQAYEADVDRETEAFRLVFHLLQIYTVTDAASDDQMRDHHVAEPPTGPRALSAPSIAGGSQTVDTEDTLDRLASPYNLVVV